MNNDLMPYGSLRDVRLMTKVGRPKFDRVEPLMTYGSVLNASLTAKVGTTKIDGAKPLMPGGTAENASIATKVLVEDKVCPGTRRVVRLNRVAG